MQRRHPPGKIRARMWIRSKLMNNQHDRRLGYGGREILQYGSGSK